MCTRYLIELSPELRPIIEEAKRSNLSKNMEDRLGRTLVIQGEVRPTNMVPVIAPDQKGEQKVFPMVWGFRLPGLRSPIVNARSETASMKPAFQESWQRRRCLIPASCYFEWEHIKKGNRLVPGDKYAIRTPGQEVTWLAGLYRIESLDDGFLYPAFTVLTRTPSGELAGIHNRMPVVLAPEMIRTWIRPSIQEEEIRDICRQSLTEMTMEKVTV